MVITQSTGREASRLSPPSRYLRRVYTSGLQHSLSALESDATTLLPRHTSLRWSHFHAEAPGHDLNPQSPHLQKHTLLSWTPPILTRNPYLWHWPKQALLAELGDDVRRSALRGTARRYVSSLLASTSGYQAKLPGSDARAAATAVVSVEAVKSKLLPIAADSEARLPYCDSCVEAMDAESSQARRVACAERCCSSSTCCHSTSHSVSVLTQAGRPHAVLQASVPFHSQCEHHMLPFYGHVHVALIAPEGDSAFNTAAAAAATCESIEAVVAMYTRRLQVQERITQQVADAVAQLHGVPDGDESTARGGVLVVVDAAHMCMVARGVENHAGATTSVASRGCFRSGQELRQSVLRQARLAAMRVER